MQIKMCLTQLSSNEKLEDWMIQIQINAHRNNWTTNQDHIVFIFKLDSGLEVEQAQAGARSHGPKVRFYEISFKLGLAKTDFGKA